MTTPDSVPETTSDPADDSAPGTAVVSADLEQPRRTRRALPLTWGITLAFSTASLTGLLAFTSDLAATDARLTDGVGQVAKIDGTTTRGLLATETLPLTDAAVRQSTPAVLATTDSLRRANTALATLGEQVKALAEVLTDTQGTLKRTVATTAETDQTVRRIDIPSSHILDLLRSLDRRTVSLHPALNQTLRLSREIEAKLRVLGYLPAAGR